MDLVITDTPRRLLLCSVLPGSPEGGWPPCTPAAAAPAAAGWSPAAPRPPAPPPRTPAPAPPRTRPRAPAPHPADRPARLVYVGT